MIASTNLKVALAHLTSRVKQALVAMLSVTFGISMYVFMNSFMSGVNETQSELAFSTLAHVKIYNDGPQKESHIAQRVYPSGIAINVRNARTIQYTEGIRNSAKIIDILQRQPEVYGVAPQVNVRVFYRNGATKINGSLSGIDVAMEDHLFKTSNSMIEGNWYDLQSRGDGILLGIGLAEKLGVGMHDDVRVQATDGVDRSYQVIGILKTTIVSLDNSKGYIRINSARQLISENQGYASEIQVNMKDFEESAEFAERFNRVISYKVEDWKEANGQLDAGNELRNMIALAVSLTILIVAGFGIYNIMNMTVNEKIKEIAIMKAMGFEGYDIVQIFLTQSIIIGILGGFVGLILGYSIATIIDHYPFQIGGLETLPMAYRLEDYLMALLFGLMTTFVAGYLPAKKASRVDPVAIIRG